MLFSIASVTVCFFLPVFCIIDIIKFHFIQFIRATSSKRNNREAKNKNFKINEHSVTIIKKLGTTFAS